MYTIIVFVIVGFVIGLFLMDFDRVFFAFTFGFVGGLIGLVIAMFLSGVFTKQVITTSTVDLLAMRSSDTISGSFAGTFLFSSGRIGGELDYTYYQTLPDGGYRAERVNAESSDVTVYEDRTNGGKLITHQCTLEQKYSWMESFVVMPDSYCGTTYEFHIPKGSLVQQFNIQP